MFFRFCRPILDIFGFPLLISEINAAKVVGKKVCPLIHLSFVYCLSCSFDAKIFLQIVGQRRASPWNDKSCLNKPICNSQFTAGKKNKHVICRLKVGLYSEKLWPWSWKCCPRPSSTRSQFFTIRTSQLANNTYISHVKVPCCFHRSSDCHCYSYIIS